MRQTHSSIQSVPDAPALPTEGYVRLAQIIKPKGVIPVGRTRWYRGIEAGEFPPPKKIGTVSLWGVSEIRDVIRRIAEGELTLGKAAWTRGSPSSGTKPLPAGGHASAP